MTETTTNITPPAKPHSALRFPLATAGQVRREVARQLGTVPHARRWFLLAVVLLAVGSYATVLVPQLMGQIVDLVTGNGAAKVDLAQPIVTTCGSGITASVIALALARLGREGVAVYDGSWTEWGGLADTPIVTGP